jgi:hypothetical protein
MRTIEALRREAGSAARWRGHRLTWTTIRQDERRTIARGTCRQCQASVDCNTRPEPNGIDIGGEAVAINCTRPARHRVGFQRKGQ